MNGHRDPTMLRRLLEADGHDVPPSGLVRCPNPDHEDRHPSCKVYDDERGGHAHCFACGWHADAFTYLVKVLRMPKRVALDLLDGAAAPITRRRSPQPSARTGPTLSSVRECEYEPLQQAIVEAHMARVCRAPLPKALHGRGFTEGDLLYFGIRVDGDDAIFPIHGPDGSVVRLKRRFGAASTSGAKYVYEVTGPGGGAPAWCSPGFGAAATVLVTEGELNAMVMHLARPDVDVVGVAGVRGCLPIEHLRGRDVVLYADGDAAGTGARDRWTAALAALGVASFWLDPWPDGDACDIAGRFGRAALAERLK